MGQINHQPNQFAGGPHEKSAVHFIQGIACGMHIGISVKRRDEHCRIVLLPEGQFIPSAALRAGIFLDSQIIPFQTGINSFDK
jgi:hypothetical protein